MILRLFLPDGPFAHVRRGGMDVTAAQQRLLGARLRALRQACGMTQEQVAELAEVHPTYLPRIESGSVVPSVDVLVRMAEALGTPAGFVLGAVDEQPHAEELTALRQEIAALMQASDVRELRLVRDLVRDVRRHWPDRA